MKVTKDVIRKEYYQAISTAEKEILKKKYNNALGYFEYAARIAYRFPIISNFIDENIEKNLKIIAENKFSSYMFHPENDDKIVYYCSQLRDNGALVEQYLDYFIEREKQVLIIVPDIKETKNGEVIFSKIKNYNKIKLFIPCTKDKIQKIKEIREEIQKFKPDKAFLHFTPWDIIGFVTFSNLNIIPRFFIVHTDHTFWIGKNCADYFIEFRKFGIAISEKRREINRDKIFHIPFYPINNGKSFEGLPFDTCDKIIGISGASLYKYYLDKNLTYFKIIAELLRENINFIFCLCAISGNPSRIYQIFNNFGVQDRFFYLGDRKDFYNLVGNCNIFFESYPQKGGLSMLYAIEQKIPVIGISTQYNSSGSIQDFLEIKEYKEPANFDEFKSLANKLIKSSSFRDTIADKLIENKYKKEYFTNSMDNLFKSKFKLIQIEDNINLELNDEAYFDEILQLPDANYGYLTRFKLRCNFIMSVRIKVLIEIFIFFRRYSFRDFFRLCLLDITGY
ncbi:MAG: hypothetical protein ACOYLE_01220 [Bacteroidales bacterium]